MCQCACNVSPCDEIRNTKAPDDLDNHAQIGVSAALVLLLALFSVPTAPPSSSPLGTGLPQGLSLLFSIPNFSSFPGLPWTQPRPTADSCRMTSLWSHAGEPTELCGLPSGEAGEALFLRQTDSVLIPRSAVPCRLQDSSSSLLPHKWES